MAAPRQTKSRNWCWTLNNYTAMELVDIEAYFNTKHGMYLCYGKETGDNGTPHLQGYSHFTSPQAFSAVKRMNNRVHLEMCKGNAEENIQYCSKDPTAPFTEFGTRPVSQQVANTLKQKRFIELSKAGDFATIEEEMPGKFIQQYRTMKQLATDYMVKPQDLEGCCGIWIYGETGSGKTTAARTEYGEYFSKTTNKWWDGYQGEETVIIEDLDPNHNKLGHHLKLWTDKWSFPAEVKCGMRCLRPTRVIITSQYSIEEIFPDEPATVEALKRRCKVIHMHKALVVPTLSPPHQRRRMNEGLLILN